MRVGGSGRERWEGKRDRLEESALDRARSVEGGTDWKRAHLIVGGSGRERGEGERDRLEESALESGREWKGKGGGRKGPTGRERT